MPYPDDYRADLSGETAPDYTPTELLGIRLERVGQTLATQGDRATGRDLMPHELAELAALVRAAEAVQARIAEFGL